MSAAIRPAALADIEHVKRLLEASGLPTADIATGQVQLWIVPEGTAIAAAIGLERRGPAALLRSLVVAPDRRGQGLASELVRQVELQARASGIAQLVLLTQTAEAFFARRGYALTERERVPGEIRACAEFQSLCPASAACMTKLI